LRGVIIELFVLVSSDGPVRAESGDRADRLAPPVATSIGRFA
jgi:hypothetical protein